MIRATPRIAAVALTLCAIVVFAQLLIGPVAALQSRGLISKDAANKMEDTIFFPAAFAAEISPAFYRVALQYVKIWESAPPVTASPGNYQISPDLSLTTFEPAGN